MNFLQQSWIPNTNGSNSLRCEEDNHPLLGSKLLGGETLSLETVGVTPFGWGGSEGYVCITVEGPDSEWVERWVLYLNAFNSIRVSNTAQTMYHGNAQSIL
jgi:hypothetical protein